MRFATWLVAILTLVIGIVGLVSPDTVMMVRRQYLATPYGLYAAGTVRVAMGLALILFAPASRFPRTLRVFGALMCVQGFVPQFFGVERARARLEWEATLGPTVLRVGAAVALATGIVVAYAAGAGRRPAGGAT